ncbi:MAG: hypothetical protein RLZZ468_1036 [Cyanobacteriota bacterium]
MEPDRGLMPHRHPSPGSALLLRDLRSPAGPMKSFTLKLPTELIDALDQAAATHAAPRSTIARNVLALGLDLGQPEVTATP